MTSLLLATSLVGCAGVEMTPAEKEIAETLGTEAFQPATRSLRDSIETQDLLSQASFWSREYQLNPGDLEAAIKLAAVVRRMGNPNRAIEITQTTRALYPKDPYLVAEYAAALIASERGADALPVIEQALQWQSNYARLWSLRGAALDQAERYADARKSYEKALSITPYDPNILANLGLSHALQGDAKTAEMWLERAVAIPGASESVRQNLDLVRQLRGTQPAPVARNVTAQLPRQFAPQTRPQQGAPAQAAPQRRFQVMDPAAGNAMSAARQMQAPPQASRQPFRQAAPVRAGDPNALERLARNASPHTRSTSPFAQRQQMRSQTAMKPQQMPSQQVPLQAMQQPSPPMQQGYQPLPGYPAPPGFAQPGYGQPIQGQPVQGQQMRAPLRGPKRPRR